MKKFIKASLLDDSKEMFAAICNDILNIDPHREKNRLKIPPMIRPQDVVALIKEHKLDATIEIIYGEIEPPVNKPLEINSYSNVPDAEPVEDIPLISTDDDLFNI